MVPHFLFLMFNKNPSGSLPEDNMFNYRKDAHNVLCEVFDLKAFYEQFISSKAPLTILLLGIGLRTASIYLICNTGFESLFN